ncbi:SseB family protein [Streptomyces sp. M10(2022)]
MRWVCGFTDEAALARFALSHASGDQSMEYAALLGARIVDEVVPSLEGPAGLAVDIATEGGSMFFPPVGGIVPVAVALDVDSEGAGDERRRWGSQLRQGVCREVHAGRGLDDRPAR